MRFSAHTKIEYFTDYKEKNNRKEKKKQNDYSFIPNFVLDICICVCVYDSDRAL